MGQRETNSKVIDLNLKLYYVAEVKYVAFSVNWVIGK